MKARESYESGNRYIVIQDEALTGPIVLTPDEAEELSDELNKLVK